jgi:two-component system, NarL family, nitrate/nitrite response regulator NarL
VRILIVDDHPLVRDGIASLLAAWGHEIVGLGSSGADGVRLADTLIPDLVLMDVRMPGGSGIEATARIRELRPEVPVVMLTVSEDESDLFDAIRAGAQGYLLKNMEPAQLRSLVEAVGRGEAAITPVTAARILEAFGRQERQVPASRPAAPDALTPREVEVLSALTGGMRNKEIAAHLGISENTVKFHIRNIVGKVHAQSRAELAARAVREGLLDDPAAGLPRRPAPASPPRG